MEKSKFSRNIQTDYKPTRFILLTVLCRLSQPGFSGYLTSQASALRNPSKAQQQIIHRLVSFNMLQTIHLHGCSKPLPAKTTDRHNAFLSRVLTHRQIPVAAVSFRCPFNRDIELDPSFRPTSNPLQKTRDQLTFLPLRQPRLLSPPNNNCFLYLVFNRQANYTKPRPFFFSPPNSTLSDSLSLSALDPSHYFPSPPSEAVEPMPSAALICPS